MDFNPSAYPHRDGIEMRDGNGELRGFTLHRHDHSGYPLHEAWARMGDKVRYVGDHADMWTAYGMIEMYYATEDYYGEYYAHELHTPYYPESEVFADAP